jgi:hypothetical protein
MGIEATLLIGPSRSRLAADVVWLGFTAFVFAVILVIICWPLSGELSVRNPPGVASSKPTTGLTSGTSVAPAAATPLPALAGGDRIARDGILPAPTANIGDGSNLAPTSPTASRSELTGPSLTPPDRSAQTAQFTSAPAAVVSPGTHRLLQHKPRARPVPPKAPPQPTP